MRRTILAILATLLLTTSLRAADPAPAGAPAAKAPTRILILPFSMTGGDAKYAWIGQAISENFQAELAKAGFSIATPIADRPGQQVGIANPDEALRIAQNSKAEVVIFGSYQFLDPDLRVTGQILDVPSNQPVGALKASGAFRQLFTLEDDLAEQTKKILVGEKPADRGEVLEPRPPLAPYDTNTTAADDRPEYKVPYAEPPAYEDDYLGVGYTGSFYPSYYRPRVYSFIGYSNYDYYYPYASCYPYFFPSYCYTPYYYSSWRHCYYPRSYFGSGVFLSFNFSHFSGHHWNDWHGSNWNWRGHDSRGPRFGDRPRSIMFADRGPAGHDFFHGTANYSVSRMTRERTTASRVINIDHDRTTVVDRATARTAPVNHAGAQLVDSTRRYTRASDNEVVAVRHPDRTVEIRTQRRADSDAHVTSDRVFDRSNPDGPRETARTRDNDTPRARADDRPREPVRSREVDRPRETPRETPRESARESRPRESAPRDIIRFRDPTPSREPTRSAPSRGDSGVSSSRGDSGSRGGGSSSSSSRGGGGGGGSSSSRGGGDGGGSSRGGGRGR
ncbi:MAG TPA: hypothetical protein VGQ99_06680 [Tepidisphaeraceae bacterium]|nr:hypothetical protein [Tepidisphaeraceae bacterium]